MKRLALCILLLACEDPRPYEDPAFLETREVKQHTAHAGTVEFSLEPCGEPVTSASVNTTADLFVCVRFSGFARRDRHGCRISIFMPQGSLWTYGDYPDCEQVVVSWPIGGTDIAGRQLTGTWRADAILNDNAGAAYGSIELVSP